MMTIKEQFISEIKERIALQKDLLKREEDSARIEGSIDALQGLLNSMDSLESEKPMNQEGLEEEIEREWNDCDGKHSDTDYQIVELTKDDFSSLARHFAQWGAEHTPLPEDTVLFNKGVEEGKRLMMEEAVEGHIVSKNDGWNSIELPSTFFGELSKNYKDGDKVRIIVLPKED